MAMWNDGEDRFSIVTTLNGVQCFSLHLYNRAEDVARVLELTKAFLKKT